MVLTRRETEVADLGEGLLSVLREMASVYGQETGPKSGRKVIL